MSRCQKSLSSLTSDRIFGRIRPPNMISPAPAGCAARPSGGSFHVWARELLANQLVHSALGSARCQFMPCAGASPTDCAASATRQRAPAQLLGCSPGGRLLQRVAPARPHARRSGCALLRARLGGLPTPVLVGRLL